MVENVNTLQHLARQGNPQAIQTLLNSILQKHHLQAAIVAHEQTLKIQIAGDAIPKETQASAIFSWLQKLNIDQFEQVIIQGIHPHSQALLWSKQFQRENQPEPTIKPQSFTPEPLNAQTLATYLNQKQLYPNAKILVTQNIASPQQQSQDFPSFSILVEAEPLPEQNQLIRVLVQELESRPTLHNHTVAIYGRKPRDTQPLFKEVVKITPVAKSESNQEPLQHPVSVEDMSTPTVNKPETASTQSSPIHSDRKQSNSAQPWWVDQNHQTHLASRWCRLGGSILDKVILSIVSFPIAKLLGYWDKSVSQTLNGRDIMQLIVVIFLVFVALNGYLLATQGQTIGKKIMGIRIVSIQNQQVPLWRLLLLRYLPYELIGGWGLMIQTLNPSSYSIWMNLPNFFPLSLSIFLISIVLLLIQIIPTINVLFIFGENQRCLHDYIAGTQVVEV